MRTAFLRAAVFILALAAATAGSLRGEEAEGTPPTLTGTAAAVIGARTRGDDGHERWTVRIARPGEPKPIDGRVRIDGVRGLFAGALDDIQWRLDGPALSGSVARAGLPVATFEGTVSPEGAGGTFTLGNGTSGSWTWEGPLPGREP